MQEAVVGISHVKGHFQPRIQLTPVSRLVSRLARSASDDRVGGAYCASMIVIEVRAYPEKRGLALIEN
jgi:hypothetical protein